MKSKKLTAKQRRYNRQCKAQKNLFRLALKRLFKGELAAYQEFIFCRSELPEWERDRILSSVLWEFGLTRKAFSFWESSYHEWVQEQQRKSLLENLLNSLPDDFKEAIGQLRVFVSRHPEIRFELEEQIRIMRSAEKILSRQVNSF